MTVETWIWLVFVAIAWAAGYQRGRRVGSDEVSALFNRLADLTEELALDTKKER